MNRMEGRGKKTTQRRASDSPPGFVCPYGLIPWLTPVHQPTLFSVFSPNHSTHPWPDSYRKWFTSFSSDFR
jgi:hypothetical protein